MQEKRFKKPWEEQFSEGSPPPETVGEREEHINIHMYKTGRTPGPAPFLYKSQST